MDPQKIKKISKGIAEKVQRLYQENWKIKKQYDIYKYNNLLIFMAL
jgi:hypothetical protein